MVDCDYRVEYVRQYNHDQPEKLGSLECDDADGKRGSFVFRNYCGDELPWGDYQFEHRVRRYVQRCGIQHSIMAIHPKSYQGRGRLDNGQQWHRRWRQYGDHIQYPAA